MKNDNNLIDYFILAELEEVSKLVVEKLKIYEKQVKRKNKKNSLTLTELMKLYEDHRKRVSEDEYLSCRLNLLYNLIHNDKNKELRTLDKK